MPGFTPSYISGRKGSSLAAKAALARTLLSECALCPRCCRVNRLKGETGICRTAAKAVVASYDAHFGEESPLVGRNGSGTIFFTHCNLLCNFCQNYEISHRGEGVEVCDDQLAAMMLALQASGCHNINFVTPTHVVPQILSALVIAVDKGLRIPLVYNSSGYDSVETLKILEGVIDIYMPDFKFWDSIIAGQTCRAPDYPEVARQAIAEMHRQVGDLRLDDSAIAVSGLLVRHLVLPQDLAGTSHIMDFIAKHISTNTYVNIMPQYRPCGRAAEVKAMARAITEKEYDAALEATRRAGIQRLDRRRRTFMLF